MEKKNLLDYGFPLFLFQEKKRIEKKEKQLDIRDFFLLKSVGESEVEDNHHQNKEDEKNPHHQP